MKLLSNWQAVLTRAWSVRFGLIAAFFSGLEVALPILGNFLMLPDRTFAAIAGVTAALAVLSRVVAQDNIPAKDPAPAEPLPVDLPDELEQ